jgi:predicted esterase
MRHLVVVGLALVTSLAAACGSSEPGAPPGGEPTSTPDAALAPTPDAGQGTGSSGASGASGSSGSSGLGGGPDAATDAGGDAPAPTGTIDPTIIAAASCTAAVPAAGARALPLPVYAGTCPTLAAPPALTTLATAGGDRTFLVYRPTTPAPGETLPVVFLYHWLGGSADAMASALDVQTAVDARRFVAVIPTAKSDLLFRWPFEATEPQSRIDEEARFFDDMLACVGAAFPVNKECVSSVGVSAGALWTAQLATQRSQHLASMVSLSGGTSGIVRGWSTVPHRLPALVLWGGPTDMYPANVPLMNFDNASHDLMGNLTKDGHYLVECTHNCGHAVPPFDAPPAGSGGLLFDPVWRFVLDHPYWLPAAKSPYAGKPLPAAYPAWCGQGQGSATPRAAGSACP